jgi:hypothetical protein
MKERDTRNARAVKIIEQGAQARDERDELPDRNTSSAVYGRREQKRRFALMGAVEFNEVAAKIEAVGTRFRGGEDLQRNRPLDFGVVLAGDFKQGI